MITDHQAKRVGLLRLIISIPFIYGAGIGLIMLDITVSLYQAICFPLYKIPKIRRSEYIQFNRGKILELNWSDKINCHYCSYANGLLAYARRIVAETERTWCPIRHVPVGKFHEPKHHEKFVIRVKKEELEEYYQNYEKELNKPEDKADNRDETDTIPKLNT